MNASDYPPSNNAQAIERAGVRYSKLIRTCDDPSLNFQQIRDRRLWEERERKNLSAENAKSADVKI